MVLVCGAGIEVKAVCVYVCVAPLPFAPHPSWPLMPSPSSTSLPAGRERNDDGPRCRVHMQSVYIYIYIFKCVYPLLCVTVEMCWHEEIYSESSFFF